MLETRSVTVEYLETYLSYFSQFATNPLFEPELLVATRVVALMRDNAHTDRFGEIVRAMHSLDQQPHYDGSGWHGFKHGVRRWLEDRGYSL